MSGIKGANAGEKCARYVHGETKTRLHKIWESMIARCEYEKHPYYADYGGKGITVCDEWHSYIEFRDWALSNGYSDELTIDRIDVNGDYCPNNCRWTTTYEQNNNKRTSKYISFNGKTGLVREFADKYIDKNQSLQEDGDMLWHGSNQYIEGQLIPHKSFHYEPYVYATTDLYYALVRAGKFNVNELLLKEDYDGNSYTLIELSENAIENIFNTDGYIYVVDKEKFTHTKDCMCNEFISIEPCDIIDTLHIENILDKMKHYNNFYKFIRYGSDEEKEYWKTVRGGKEGYLQRRKERIQKLITHKNGVLTGELYEFKQKI